jgi:predicted Zn-dependent peptidase
MPGAQSVTVLILVGVGSRYEEKNINGLSHFLEHMAFKGTQKRPSALAIASTIDGIGGEFNAFTSKDHTGYYIKAAKTHLPLLVDVLSDMLLHSKFDEKEIEKEKGVIVEEINMYEDTPMRKVGDLYENLLYGDTKLGRDIAGTEDVIRSVKRQDFVDYVDRFYGPKNTVIVVAGGVEEENSKIRDHLPALPSAKLMQAGISNPQFKTQKLIEDALGKWETKEVPEFEKMTDGQKEPRILVRYKDSQQAHLCLGVRSFHNTHPNKYKLGVLTNILGGGMSSRLFIEVREKRGLAYYVRSQNEQYLDVGNFVTQAGVDVERINDAITVILEQFKRVTTEKVTKEEMEKAKEYMKGRFILELEDSRATAALYASDELLEGELKSPEEILAKIDEVTQEGIAEVAKNIFKENSLNLAVIGPYKEESKFQKLLKF